MTLRAIFIALNLAFLITAVVVHTMATQQTDPHTGPLLTVKAIAMIGFVATWSFALFAALTNQARPPVGQVIAAAYLIGTGVLFAWLLLSVFQFIYP